MAKLITVQIMVNEQTFFIYTVYDDCLDAVYLDAVATYPEATNIVLTVNQKED